MKRFYLSIERKNEASEQFKSLWKARGVEGIVVSTITEGIAKAIEIEESGTSDLYFISIVAGGINYLPQLRILSDETIAPILIATSNLDDNEREDSLNSGADYYGNYCSSLEKNLDTVVAVINSIERRAKKVKTPNRLISHSDLLVVVDYNKAYIKDIEISLTA